MTSNYRKTFFINTINSKFDLLLKLPKYFNNVIKKNMKKRNWMYKKLTKKVRNTAFIKDINKDRKIIYYNRRVLKSKQELDIIKSDFNLIYKKNKYLSNNHLENFKLFKFLTLSNYLNNLNDFKIRKFKYLFNNVINLNELQFINTSYNKLNNVISVPYMIKENENSGLSLNLNHIFFNTFSLSTFRLNILIYSIIILIF